MKKPETNNKLIFVLIFLLVVSWIIYTYTQVDLNLTLSSNSIYQSVQHFLIYIGYYQRTVSGVIFVGLLLLTFIFYILFLRFVQQGKINLTQTWLIIGATSVLILAYPAFSHDIFNYMFDARIVTKYGLDPHFFKALDFPADAWTRFMRWTHRYYPYGLGWLLISLVPSWLGMGKFVLTLLLFKGTFLIFHLLNSYLITKIARKISPAQTAWALAFYALNPLVLVESLISPHNEVVMLTFVLVGIYWLINTGYLPAVAALLISISIKFVSVVLVPWLFWKKVNERAFFSGATYLWLVMLVPVILQREFYPWYLLPVVGLAALTSGKTYIVIAGLTLGTLARYAPFIFTGEYSPTTVWYQNLSFAGASLLAVLVSWGLCQDKIRAEET